VIDGQAPVPLPPLTVLGRPLYGVQSASPLPLESLHPGERRRLNEWEHAHRRVEWLIGRHALRAAAQAAGLPADTSRLSFPHVQISLSHSPGIAIAVAVDRSCGDGVAGVGVDFERERPLSANLLRMFTTEHEAALLRDSSDADVLRLWTIKEAVFKACPRNAGLLLTDFEVTWLSPDGTGCAVLRPDLACFATSSRRHAAGWLSVALCMEP
jgi:phosphopantetheinyl transferase